LNQSSNKAVIILSGGLDSTTCLAYAKSQNYQCYALSFSYGQRHSVELNAAQKIAIRYGVIEHKIINFSLDDFGGSALTDKAIAVPDYQNDNKIPVTYVPARNTIFLSLALAYAETLSAHNIFIGVNAIEYSQYPDCRPDFIAAFQELANLATKTGVSGQPIKIHAPLISLTKKEIIRLGLSLDVDYGMTISCYRADINNKACGKCDSCALRQKGFADLGMSDPVNAQSNGRS
jgi:7-cyano-7-deazaguanine synthase